VCNFEWATPASGRPEDVAAAARYDAIYNRFFLGGIFKGAYPDLALEGLEPHLPLGWQDDFGVISTPVDWSGINYYTRTLIHDDAKAPWPRYSQSVGDLPTTSMGWEIYPDALRAFLVRMTQEYTGNLPIYVTENGMSAPDVIQDKVVADPHRIEYLNSHLSAAKDAIAAGVPLAGYYMWSLMDNYEWALGYEKRFGLIHVDFDTFERTPKQSYHALAEALRT
jgi:beta-glucosidase